MKQLILRLVVACATFAAGVTCATSFHAVFSYQAVVLQAKERTLRENLVVLRKALDQYAAENGAHPESLDALVHAGHIRGVPVDPITGQRDWAEERISFCGVVTRTSLTIDVRSASTATSSEGTPYSEW